MKNLANKIKILNEQKGDLNLFEHVTEQSESDPNFFRWLSDEDLQDDFNSSLTKEQQEEFDNWLLELRKKALLEKWIIVKMNFTNDDETRVTLRRNFDTEKVCDGYDSYGQLIGCYNASCYALDNPSSSIGKDLLLAIDSEMKVNLYNAFDAKFGTDFNSIDNLIEKIDSLNEREVCYKEVFNYTNVDTKAVRVFAEKWLNDNENHTEDEQWTYWDGSNYNTISLTDDCTELDKESQIEILLEMPQTKPYISNTYKIIKTKNYEFSFDRWSTNPWYCIVEHKLV
jgi:hypothetical protein